ncbi:hypothetical protein TNCV_602021 [Trichonephila clavipes]|nr:hypothetical protein TNCV_602021 [Trichonephila clavipes]
MLLGVPQHLEKLEVARTLEKFSYPWQRCKTVRTPSHDRDESDFNVDQEPVRRSSTCFQKSAEVEVKVLMREVG